MNPEAPHLDTTKSIEDPKPKPDHHIEDEKFWINCIRTDINELIRIVQEEKKYPNPALIEKAKGLLPHVNALNNLVESRTQLIQKLQARHKIIQEAYDRATQTLGIDSNK